MIEMTFIVCLIDEPEKCREEKMNLEVQTTFQCMLVSQIELAKWFEAHPKYRIKKWICSASRHNNI